MADFLAIVWFASAGLGLFTALSGLLVTNRRREFLLAAAACFVVAGILGLASIGVLFVGLAAGCTILARRTASPRRPGRNTELCASQ